MIPKIIHYCWFGNFHTEEQILKLNTIIKQWQKVCPDYQIIEWNESNFNFKENKFASEAYFTKKWAFVADYARLKVLEEYGGIYLDTDVELLKNFDSLLNYPAFIGFENNHRLCSAVIGAEKNNKVIQSWLSYYKNPRSFILWIGALWVCPNTVIYPKILRKIDPTFLIRNQEQSLKYIKIFTKDVFSPKNYNTKKITLTNNTIAIHHFGGSWLDIRMWSLKYISYKWKTRHHQWKY